MEPRTIVRPRYAHRYGLRLIVSARAFLTCDVRFWECSTPSTACFRCSLELSYSTQPGTVASGYFHKRVFQTSTSPLVVLRLVDIPLDLCGADSGALVTDRPALLPSPSSKAQSLGLHTLIRLSGDQTARCDHAGSRIYQTSLLMPLCVWCLVYPTLRDSMPITQLKAHPTASLGV